MPDRIELVPEHQKFIETLGWQWGIWGSFCLFLALLIMAPWKGPPLSMQWEISAISGATGLCLAGYEIWRRRNRTVLVKDGEQIAVYRKGRLDLIIAPREIILVKTGLDIILEVGIGLELLQCFSRQSASWNSSEMGRGASSIPYSSCCRASLAGLP